MLAFDSVEDNWLYAPPQQVRDFTSGKVREHPYASRVFGLPKTHLIEHTAATSEKHLDFHLWALSFFVGMRLTATEAGFLDATPLKPSKIVDFILLGSSLTRAVKLADDFWRTNLAKPRRAQHFEAAVHALFLSQSPKNLKFESSCTSIQRLTPATRWPRRYAHRRVISNTLSGSSGCVVSSTLERPRGLG